MQAGSCASTERNSNVHEVRILGDPLVRLTSAHGPPNHAVKVLDLEMLCDEPMLSTNIVVKGYLGEWVQIGSIGRRHGLAVAKEGRNDYEVLACVQMAISKVWQDRLSYIGWIQGFPWANQPYVVCNGCEMSLS